MSNSALVVMEDDDTGLKIVNFRFDTQAPGFNISEEIERFEDEVYSGDKYAGMQIGTSVESIRECDNWACELPTFQHLVVWASFFNARNTDGDVILSSVDMGELDFADVGVVCILDMIKRLEKRVLFIGD